MLAPKDVPHIWQPPLQSAVDVHVELGDQGSPLYAPGWHSVLIRVCHRGKRQHIYIVARRFTVQESYFTLGKLAVKFPSAKYGIWRLAMLSEFTIKVNIGTISNKVVVHKKGDKLVGYKLLQ